MSAFVNPFRRALSGFALAAGLVLSVPDAARADGEFLQFDLSETATDAVFAVSRDRFSFNGNYSEYDSGSATTFSVSYAFPIDGIGTFRIGPSVSRSVADGWTITERTRNERKRRTSTSKNCRGE